MKGKVFILAWIAAIFALGCGGNTKQDTIQSGHAYYAAFEGSLCEQWLALEGSVAAVLPATFGENPDCMQRFWETTPGHTTIIYLSNEAGRRNQRLFAYELHHTEGVSAYNARLETGSLEKVRARILLYRHYVYPWMSTGRFILVTGLESQYTERARQRLTELIRAEWPGEIGHNDVKNTCPADQNIWCELHGYTSQPPKTHRDRCILNGDGDPSFNESQIWAWYFRGISDCIMITWEHESQGLVGEFVEPRLRQFRYDATKYQFIKRLIFSVPSSVYWNT